jgi:hypothetical protein
MLTRSRFTNMRAAATAKRGGVSDVFAGHARHVRETVALLGKPGA